MIEINALLNPVISFIGGMLATARDMLLGIIPSPWNELLLFGLVFALGFYSVRQKWIISVPGYVLTGVLLYLLVKFARGGI